MQYGAKGDVRVFTQGSVVQLLWTTDSDGLAVSADPFLLEGILDHFISAKTSKRTAAQTHKIEIFDEFDSDLLNLGVTLGSSIPDDADSQKIIYGYLDTDLSVPVLVSGWHWLRISSARANDYGSIRLKLEEGTVGP